MSLEDKIEAFLAGQRFAVVGASRNRNKYGNKVLRVFQQNNRNVVPINPNADEVEGLRSFSSLASMDEPVDGVSIITPPAVTEQVIAQAIELGIEHVWMQPGAESQSAIDLAERAGINVIAGGPCVLVSLRFREDA